MKRLERYRGYWIVVSPFDAGSIYVQMDGHTLATCPTIEAARAAVDSILD